MLYENAQTNATSVLNEIDNEKIKLGLSNAKETVEEKEKVVVNWIKGFPFTEIVVRAAQGNKFVLVGNELLSAIYSFYKNKMSLSEKSTKEVIDFIGANGSVFKGSYETLPVDIRMAMSEANMIVTTFHELTNEQAIDYANTRSKY